MSEQQDRPVSTAEVTNEIAEAIERAGLHPAHAFAVRQCGFLLTQMNVNNFSDDEIDAWEDALDLWFEMHPDAPKL